MGLDKERRRLIHANERRLERYIDAARGWSAIWKEVEYQTVDLPLDRAHEVIVKRAEGVLPYRPPREQRRG
jgi:hypothetical protein